jgi:hypothetical protein
MSFKDIVFDPNTNSLLFRTRRAGGKSISVPMTSFVPIGTVMPICSHLSGAYNCTATTVPDSSGFVQCNGQTINDPSSPMHNRAIPDVNGSSDADPVFLRGSTSPSSTKAGSNTHTLDASTMPSHSHPIGGNTGDGGSHGHNIFVAGRYVGCNIGQGNQDWGHSPNCVGYQDGDYSALWWTDGQWVGHGHSLPANTDGYGSSTAITHIPKYLSVKYIIRVK